VRCRISALISAGTISSARVDRRPAGGDAPGQEIRPVLRAEERDQVVLHIMLGREHGPLIGEEQLLEARILHADAVRDLAIVEDVPLNGGTDLDRAASPAREHVAEHTGSAQQSQGERRTKLTASASGSLGLLRHPSPAARATRNEEVSPTSACCSGASCLSRSTRFGRQALFTRVAYFSYNPINTQYEYFSLDKFRGARVGNAEERAVQGDVRRAPPPLKRRGLA
jgi:hypothetical protein